MKSAPATKSESLPVARLHAALKAPLTVTISGNIAAAMRFSAFTAGVSVEDHVEAAFVSFAHCQMTDLMRDAEAEQWLAESTVKKEGV